MASLPPPSTHGRRQQRTTAPSVVAVATVVERFMLVVLLLSLSSTVMKSPRAQIFSGYCFALSSNVSKRRNRGSASNHGPGLRPSSMLKMSPSHPRSRGTTTREATTLMMTVLPDATTDSFNNNNDGKNKHKKKNKKVQRKYSSSNNSSGGSARGSNDNDSNRQKRTTTTAEGRRSAQTQKQTSIAIIGGGIAGLSCARHLLDIQRKQHQNPTGDTISSVTVFDTGRLRPGGRTSSRHPNDFKSKESMTHQFTPPPTKSTESKSSFLDKLTYDHAAQFVTVPRRLQGEGGETARSSSSSWRSDFDQWVHELHESHVLKLAPPDTIFNMNIHSRTATGTSEIQFESLQSSYDFYYPTTGGVSSLAQYLAAGGTGTGSHKSATHYDDDLLVMKVSTTAVDDDEKSSEDGDGNIITTTARMNPIPIDVRQDVWVSPSNGVKYLPQTGQWRLFAKGKRLNPHYDYDQLIIAHNGKCADRLMSQTPAQKVHSLLRVNFSDSVLPKAQKMTLNSIYSYTICLKSPSVLSKALPKDLIAGFVTTTTGDADSTKKSAVRAHPRISLITNQFPAKYNKDSIRDAANFDDEDEVEVWTVFSTASFAKMHKAPQESLPDDVVATVTHLLLDSLQNDIISASKSVSDDGEIRQLRDQILDYRLQLWGAALPLNVWDCPSDDKKGNSGFLYDPEHGVGVCGDWLMEASIAGAWTSGKRLAEHILATSATVVEQAPTVGLNGGTFKSSAAVQRFGIGSLLNVPDLPHDFQKNANTSSEGTSGQRRNNRAPPKKSIGRKIGDQRSRDGTQNSWNSTKQREKVR